MAKTKFKHYVYGIGIVKLSTIKDIESETVEDRIFEAFVDADEYIKNELLPKLHSYLSVQFDEDDWVYSIFDSRTGKQIAYVYVRTFDYYK
jgi:hypothetical protein